MSDIKQQRRLNLEALIREYKKAQSANGRKGKLREFYQLHAIDESHGSQIRCGRREIGDDVARRIEEKHKPRLPAGWLDLEHNETDPQGAREEAYAKLAITLYRKNPREAQRMMNDFKAEIAKSNSK